MAVTVNIYDEMMDMVADIISVNFIHDYTTLLCYSIEKIGTKKRSSNVVDMYH